MSQATLDQRLAELERQVADLKAEVHRLAQPTDWRSAVGMFAGDEVMKRIDEAGRRIREADRQRARKAAKAKRRKVRT